jgi:hypothetical protein
MQFQYRVERVDSKFSFRKGVDAETNMMNSLGHLGWELVSVDTNSEKSLTRMYFKRSYEVARQLEPHLFERAA